MEKKEKNELAEMSRFITNFSFDNLDTHSIEKLKLHVLDSIGCAVAALGSEPVKIQKTAIEKCGSAPQCALIGTSLKTSLDRAAQYLTALIRYVDFMDNFLAKHGTCHPSDNIGSLLAVCDHYDLNGRKFLEAMAVAYNVQCRMIDLNPAWIRVLITQRSWVTR
jgi:2-methylcitrate dehydratase